LTELAIRLDVFTIAAGEGVGVGRWTELAIRLDVFTIAALGDGLGETILAPLAIRLEVLATPMRTDETETVFGVAGVLRPPPLQAGRATMATRTARRARLERCTSFSPWLYQLVFQCE
jgi:hypothetical protein